MLPWVVSNYKLDELSSVQELRRNIALLFRKHSHVTAPGVRHWACCCIYFAVTGSAGRHIDRLLSCLILRQYLFKTLQ